MVPVTPIWHSSSKKKMKGDKNPMMVAYLVKEAEAHRLYTTNVFAEEQMQHAGVLSGNEQPILFEDNNKATISFKYVNSFFNFSI